MRACTSVVHSRVGQQGAHHVVHVVRTLARDTGVSVKEADRFIKNYLDEYAGVRDYSIFLDEGTGALFAVLRRADGHAMSALPQHPVMRRWWDHMADLMETQADASPVSSPLLPVFHLA